MHQCVYCGWIHAIVNWSTTAGSGKRGSERTFSLSAVWWLARHHIGFPMPARSNGHGWRAVGPGAERGPYTSRPTRARETPGLPVCVQSPSRFLRGLCMPCV
jgi:hypothetical protein